MLPLLDKAKIKHGSDFVTMLMDHLVKNRFPRKDFDKVAAIIVTLDEAPAGKHVDSGETPANSTT